jgi:hypothetical protein
MNVFVVNAQEPFYNTKWEDGKMVSRTRHLLNYTGLYEQQVISKYTYDEKGDFLTKEVYEWRRKYVWNDEKGLYCPDYSENNWIPQYCIQQKRIWRAIWSSWNCFAGIRRKKSMTGP